MSHKGTTQFINRSCIKPNKFNSERSMEAINEIAESIKQNGLMSPLAVYKNGDGSYTLLSGHKRLAAYELIDGDDGDSSIPCVVYDAPQDSFEEREMMLEANMHRSKPEDITVECLIGRDLYQELKKDPEKFKETRMLLKEKFIERNKDNPTYLSDPAGFVDNNFRPLLEYIRYHTGLTLSNATIKTVLKTADDEESGSMPDDAYEDAMNEALMSELKEETKEKKQKIVDDKAMKKIVNKFLDAKFVYVGDDTLRMGCLDEMEVAANEYLGLFAD